MLSLSPQIKSDKVSRGDVIYRLEGPGVNQDPKDHFEIDEKTGWIVSKTPLDREKYNSFTVNAKQLQLIILISDSHRNECFSREGKEVSDFSWAGPCCLTTSVGITCLQLKAFALSPSGERLESPTTIEIYVLDQNDNRPNFTQPQFVGSVPEFAPPGRLSKMSPNAPHEV